jgi:hypothetical protein
VNNWTVDKPRISAPGPFAKDHGEKVRLGLQAGSE